VLPLGVGFGTPENTSRLLACQTTRRTNVGWWRSFDSPISTRPCDGS